MARTITLLRHGETEANVADLWQGQGDSPLSARGEQQVELVARRLTRVDIDLVVSSDLGRARRTAAALGRPVVVDAEWREADLGGWEGLTKDAARPQYEPFIEAVKRGEDPPFGGSGERLSEIEARAWRALSAVADSIEDGQQAVVVTHGGVIQAAARSVLGAGRPPSGLINTSLTVISFDENEPKLEIFNDASHLPPSPPNGEIELVIIRHGQSEGNVTGKWQGRFDAPLTSAGQAQAEALATLELGLSRIVTSPLRRAHATAAAVAESAGLELFVEPDLAEFDFGAWENLTSDEIAAGWPAEWHRFRVLGEDIPRGVTGERFFDGADRLKKVIAELTAAGATGRMALVSHGGVSRALMAATLDVPFAHRHRIAQLRNTAMAKIGFIDDRPRMSAWNVAPHLDL